MPAPVVSRGKAVNPSAKKPLPPPPPSSASNAVGTGKAGSGVITKTTDVTKVGPILNEATNATNALGKKAIGEGGFHADVSVGGNLDSALHDNIMSRLSGEGSKRSDIMFEGAKEKLFSATQGQTKRGRMAAMADAARRGVFRSGTTSAVVSDIETEGVKAYSEGVKDLLMQKAIMDHEDMMKAIDQGQQWLAGTRQYQLGLEQNAIGREQIKATMAAAAMQASATMYAADKALQGSRAIAGAQRAATQQAYNDSRAIQPDGMGGYISSDFSMEQISWTER